MSEELTGPDLQAACKAGFFAGFGMGYTMTNDAVVVPYANEYVPWPNMVPAWIPVGSNGQALFKKHFSDGLDAGIAAARKG